VLRALLALRTLQNTGASTSIAPATAGLERRSVCEASSAIDWKMLEFAVVYWIGSIIEMFPLNKGGIGKAFEHLDQGERRHRGVLVTEG